jgi:hypothetical protein
VRVVETGYEETESRFLSRAPGVSQGRFCAALLRNDRFGERISSSVDSSDALAGRGRGRCMAKLIYGMIQSLDGYTEDEHGKFGWGAPEDEAVHN